MFLQERRFIKTAGVMLEHPEYCSREKYREMMETFQPVYPLTAGLSNKTLRKAQTAAFDMYRAEEFLPENVRKYYGLAEEDTALREIHFPSGPKPLTEARRRIIFDEFFRFFSALELLQEKEHKTLNHYVITMGEEVRNFVDSLPYALTGAQKETLEDIRKIWREPVP